MSFIEAEVGEKRVRPGPDSAPWGVVDVILLAITLGLVIGLGEVAGLGWRFILRRFLTHITPHVVWMAPVAYAAFFLLLVPFVLLLRRFRIGRGPGSGVALFVTLGLAGWLAMTPWSLHPAAVWALALGVGVRLGMSVQTRPARVRAVTRVAAPALGLLVLFAGAIVSLRGWRAERGALASLPPASADAPNVLLLILDTVRAKSLGLHGAERATSTRLEELGGDAVVFDRAIATAPWTLPSHASMFTGRWPHELSVTWDDPLDDAEPTLAEALAERGWATAGFVGNLAYTSRHFGLDRGFAHYEDFPVSIGQAILATSLGREIATLDWLRRGLDDHELWNRKPAPRLRADLFDWLDRRPEGRPFFAFVNFYDAHEPFEPPDRFREAFAPGYRRDGVAHRHNLLRGVNARREQKWTMDEDAIVGELGLYEAAIAWLDEEIGLIVDGLEARGLLDETILVITSDHGEFMGEHDLFGHWQGLYLAATHVPLLIRPPGGVPPTRVAEPVSLVDLPATILDVAGVSTPWPGTSLRSAWEGGVPAPASVPSRPPASPAVSQLTRGLVEQSWYPIARGIEMQSLVRDATLYICNPDASEELYDLTADPDEGRNLIGSPEGDARALSLRPILSPVGAPPTWCPPPPQEAPRIPEPRR